jgi:hypothetical protein
VGQVDEVEQVADPAVVVETAVVAGMDNSQLGIHVDGYLRANE